MLLRTAKVGHRRCTKPDGGLLVERSITTSNASITRRSYGSNPAPATNKNRTFVYRQMFCFCLSKPQAWYIITARSAAYIISPFGAVSHHALACILPAAWWYTMLRIDDIPQQVADDMHAFGVIATNGCGANPSSPAKKVVLFWYDFFYPSRRLGISSRRSRGYHQPFWGCISSRVSVHLSAAW